MHCQQQGWRFPRIPRRSTAGHKRFPWRALYRREADSAWSLLHFLLQVVKLGCGMCHDNQTMLQAPCLPKLRGGWRVPVSPWAGRDARQQLLVPHLQTLQVWCTADGEFV